MRVRVTVRVRVSVRVRANIRARVRARVRARARARASLIARVRGGRRPPGRRRACWPPSSAGRLGTAGSPG